MKKSLLLLPILVIGASAYGMKEKAGLTVFQPKGEFWCDQNPQAMRTFEQLMLNTDEMPLRDTNNNDLRRGFSKLALALNGGIIADQNGISLSPILADYISLHARADEEFLKADEFYQQAKRRNYTRLVVTGLGFLGVGVFAYKWGQASAK